MAEQPDILLAQRERLTCRDQNLLPHEVEAGHHLRDRVLDLDARVHLEEEVLTVAREQAFDRAGTAVVDRSRRFDRNRADPLAQNLVDRG